MALLLSWISRAYIVSGLLLALTLSGCSSEPAVTVQTGAEALAENGFDTVEGERVGLIVNHTARVDTAHLIDAVDRASNVELGALFGPEHGLRGTRGAGETVRDGQDDRTGVPIYSLYGDTRKPTSEELEGLDALIFDVQDVGARFYTYITTMGLAMQAAAAADIPFIVLDRPNPVGGDYVSGFLLDPKHESFVGRYPIPIAHGMTVGELALMIKGEEFLPGLENLDLKIVEMDGWSRDMQWPDTNRAWTPPSPNLPTWETALLYPGMCLFEGVRVNEGRGTDHPFLQIGVPWSEDAAQAIVDTLTERSLGGISVEPTSFTPTSRPAAQAPRFEGQQLHGFRLSVTNRDSVQPVEAGVHALHAVYHQARAVGDSEFVSRPEHFVRLAGTDRLRTLLEKGASPEMIIEAWSWNVARFRDQRNPYLLY